MEQYLFQNQYPLSQKKFRKKMYASLVFLPFLIVVYGLISFTIALTMGGLLAFKGDVYQDFFLLCVGLFSFLLLLHYVVYALYIKKYLQTYFYEDKEDSSLRFREGVFISREVEIFYDRVKEICFDQDFFDRLLGIYNVGISCEGVPSENYVHLEGFDKKQADSLKVFFLKKVTKEYKKQILDKNLPGSLSSKDSFLIDGKRLLLLHLIKSMQVVFFVGGIISLKVFSVEGEKYAFLKQIIKLDFNQSHYIYLVTLFSLVFVYVGGVIAWKKNFTFSLEDTHILFVSGVISKNELIIPYEKINNVVLYQGFFQKLLGIATIKIQNTANLVYQQNLPDFFRNSIPGLPYEKAKDFQLKIQGLLPKNP